jgi:hypothetical protein
MALVQQRAASASAWTWLVEIGTVEAGTVLAQAPNSTVQESLRA